MVKKEGKNFMWTKQDIKKVLEAWDTKTVQEIANELKVPYQSVMYIAKELRKVGFDLPHKRKRGHIQILIKELFAETKKK